jgi:hypothetical protein
VLAFRPRGRECHSRFPFCVMNSLAIAARFENFRALFRCVSAVSRGGGRGVSVRYGPTTGATVESTV